MDAAETPAKKLKSSSAIEVIENEDINITKTIKCVDDIEEKIRQKYIQKTFTDNHNNATKEINEITRAVRGLEMVKNKPVVCDCEYCLCCRRHFCYDEMKNYFILLLICHITSRRQTKTIFK